jgi:splicing factor 3A subunit 3
VLIITTTELLVISHIHWQMIFHVTDMVEFTDEEGYGKYLDLHECYEKYVNLKGIEVCECHYNIQFVVKSQLIC